MNEVKNGLIKIDYVIIFMFDIESGERELWIFRIIWDRIKFCEVKLWEWSFNKGNEIF